VVQSDADTDAEPVVSDAGDAPTTPAVLVDDVRKTYQMGRPVDALAGVSVTLPRGSYTAVMGPSGSGKSTLLNLVAGLDTPTAGRVEVNGRDLAAMDERERARVRGQEVGFVFQTFNLMPRLTAAENVALPLVFQEVDRDERLDRAQALLADVGLGDRADHRPAELSGGQRQRVGIARALATDPTLLCADEPTGSVDTETGAGVLERLAAVNAAGTTVLLVTHERRVAEEADRIVHLRDGVLERIEDVGDGDDDGDGTGDDHGHDPGTSGVDDASSFGGRGRAADGDGPDESPREAH
jgi:putative ABC transport system ATP-binding protein